MGRFRKNSIYLGDSGTMNEISTYEEKIQDVGQKEEPEYIVVLENGINRYDNNQEQDILSEIEQSEERKNDISHDGKKCPDDNKMIFESFEFIAYIHR